jgi:hypothetical protein
MELCVKFLKCQGGAGLGNFGLRIGDWGNSESGKRKKFFTAETQKGGGIGFSLSEFKV